MFAILPWIRVSRSDRWLLSSLFKEPEENGKKFVNIIHGEKKKE
jgi:hypothetical protein